MVRTETTFTGVDSVTSAITAPAHIGRVSVVPFTAMMAAPKPVYTGVSFPNASTSRAASPSDEPVERIRTYEGGSELVNGHVMVVVASAA